MIATRHASRCDRPGPADRRRAVTGTVDRFITAARAAASPRDPSTPSSRSASCSCSRPPRPSTSPRARSPSSARALQHGARRLADPRALARRQRATSCGSPPSSSALVLAVLLGLVIERLIIRPMIGEPLFSIAVITLGLEAVLRTIGTDAVGVNNRSLGDPVGGHRVRRRRRLIYWSWVVRDDRRRRWPSPRVYLFFRTRTGIAMRAVAFDQEAAMAQGISVGRVFAIAWGAAAALAVLGAICALDVADRRRHGHGRQRRAGLPGPAGRDPRRARLGGRRARRRPRHRPRRGLRRAPTWPSTPTTLGIGFQLIVPYVVMLIVLLVRPYGLFGTPEIRRV